MENEICYTAGDKPLSITKKTILDAQLSDNIISKIRQSKLDNALPPTSKQITSRDERKFIREWCNLEIINGILHRKAKDKQIVLPSKLKPLIYQELHVNMGHVGTDRTLELIKSRFYWPGMTDDIKHFVTKVCPCVKRKRQNATTAAPMKNIVTSEPLQIVGMDFLHLDRCQGGYEYLLVITNLFTKFVQVYPTRNKESRTVAEKIYSDYILRFGIPGEILHDQGKEFDNNLLRHLSKFCNIRRLRTSPYHPQGNGQTERFNQTIINMLKASPEKDKLNWKDSVHKLVHAYNCTTHSSTGFVVRSKAKITD